MREPRSIVALLVCLGAGCGGVGEPSTDAGVPGGADLAGADLSGLDLVSVGSGNDLASPIDMTAPACTDLASRVTETTISVGASVDTGWPISAVALPGDGAAIAWSTGTNVYFTRVDAMGNRVGTDVMVEGTSAHGLTASPTGLATLVRRTPSGLSDELWLVDVGASGTVNVNVQLTGGNMPGLSGNNCTGIGDEFFDGFFRRGRIVWTGTQYAVYFTLQRCWPEGIAHAGDTFRLYDPNGTASVQWDWGCSHSLDVRLAQNGTAFAPVCLSDCYQTKGILLSDSTVLSNEPSGNCAGDSTASLGGLVAGGGGFWLSYTSKEGRTSSDVGLVQITSAGAVGTKLFLTQNADDESAAHLGAFGDEMLAGWSTAGGMTMLERVDGNGNGIGSAEMVAPPLRQGDDFFTYTSGDVGWAYASGSQLKIVRVRRCP
jgi:hypothetical protein